MAESYGNILSLPNDQFMSMLPELQAQGVDTDELRRSYRRANSIFSPLYDWMGGSEANVAEQGRSPVGFGLLSKPEGTTGMDAVRGLQLEPQQFMSGLLGAVAQGADAPYAAVQGQMPTQDMMGEAMNTAGLAMGSGGVVADIPAGAVGANMLRGGKMSDPTYTGWTFKDVDGNIPLSKAENKMLSEGAKAPTQEVVPIRSMYAMQDRVNPDFATTETSAGNLPNAVRKDGKIYLQDGHHRVTKVSEEGDQNVKVNLYDFDNVDKSTPLLDYSPEKAARDKTEMDSIMAELFPDDPLYANASKTGGLLGSNIPALSKADQMRREANIQRFGYDPNEPSVAADTSYRGGHQPRGPQSENPVRLDDITISTTGEKAGYPSDFYGPNGSRYYAPSPRFADDQYGIANQQSYRAIMNAKGNPDAEVTIYRAVPNEDSITSINEGDFVTLSPKYAEIHGAEGYGPNGNDAGKVISQKVKVKDIYFAGDDVNEFGYFPSNGNKPQGLLSK
jgi:hypothetical protein